MDIIGQLTDENMIMRQMIGEMKIDQQGKLIYKIYQQF